MFSAWDGVRLAQYCGLWKEGRGNQGLVWAGASLAKKPSLFLKGNGFGEKSGGTRALPESSYHLLMVTGSSSMTCRRACGEATAAPTCATTRPAA